MDRITRYIDTSATILHVLLAVTAALVSVVIFFYTTFVTKDQVHTEAESLKEFEEFRLDRLESKLDKLDDKISELSRRLYEK
jgi:predicted ribosome quality control (RQC) complex YloA/Tae2 family protein